MSTRPEPSLRGTLAGEPLARLLAAALAQRSTGTLQLQAPDGIVSEIVVARGELAKLRAPKPNFYLGSIIYELGLVGLEELNSSLHEVARTKRLHGALLVEQKHLTQAQLAQALVEQSRRKLHALFGSPKETAFAFFPNYDALAGYGAEDWPRADLRPSLWFGIREFPPLAQVEAVMGATRGVRFTLARTAMPDRLGLEPDELTLAECLGAKPLDLEELARLGALDRRRTELLLYFLLLTDSVERERAISVPPASVPPASVPPRRDSLIRESGPQPTSTPPFASTPPQASAPPSSRSNPTPPPFKESGSQPTFRSPSLPATAFASNRPGPGSLPPTSVRTPSGAPAYPSGVMSKVSPRGGMPRDPVAAGKLSDRAYAALKAGNLELAESLCNEAHQADSHEVNHAALRVWLSALRPEGQTPEATKQSIVMLSRLIALHDESAHARFFRGQLYKRVGRMAEAANDFRTALELESHPHRRAGRASPLRRAAAPRRLVG